MPDSESGQPASYACTILEAEPGHRLAKRYDDPAQPPDDYDAGWLFRAAEIECASFDEFIAMLAALPPNQCLIRGGVRAEARPDIERGTYVRRLEYDREDCAAAFEPRSRNWIMLDADDTATPLDLNDVAGSVERWRQSLPPKIRNARAAFFPSASMHRSPTVRGKLLVALAEPIDNASAESWARAHGFDGSVCRTVQPNYLAAPVFALGNDPLAGRRAAIRFDGTLASLPSVASGATDATLGDRGAVPADLPPLSDRASRLLTPEFVARWVAGDRIQTNAALHLFSWLLGKGWSRGEVGAMLTVLDEFEDDAAKIREHWHILGNARAIEGPGNAKEWLGEDFDATSSAVNYDPVVAAMIERRQRALRPVSTDYVDPWSEFTDFTRPATPLDYDCEGLRLAPSRGKISIIAGQPGGGKGPIANHLAVCFALGLPAFGVHACQQRNVLLLDKEGRLLTERRLRRMTRAAGRDERELQSRLYHLDVSTVDLVDDEAQLRIERIVADRDIGVVVLDSYTSAMLASGIDSNTPQFAVLAQLLGRIGLLVLAVAHANKAAAARGEPSLADVAYSGAFGAMAQTAVVVHYPDSSDKGLIRIGCARAPETSFAPFDVRFTDVTDDGLRCSIAAEVPRDVRGIAKLQATLVTASRHADQAEDAIRSHDIGAGVSARVIRELLGISGATWNAARAELLRRGSIIEDTLGRRVAYRLTKGAI